MNKKLQTSVLMLVFLMFSLSGCTDFDFGNLDEVTQFSITSFNVDPLVISAGETANLSWVVMSAQTVSIDQGVGNVSNVGHRAIMPSETTTFTLTAVNGTKTLTASTQIVVNDVDNDGSNGDSSGESSDDESEGSVNVDTWFFAMDTAEEYVGGYDAYRTGYIPTLVVIDVNGGIVHKSAGVHTKSELASLIEDAEQSSNERIDAPDFTLETFYGNEFRLSDQLGFPVILDLMAVRCPPCAEQMPELQKVKQEYGDDVVIISIDVDGATGSETMSDVTTAFGEYIKEE